MNTPILKKFMLHVIVLSCLIATEFGACAETLAFADAENIPNIHNREALPAKANPSPRYGSINGVQIQIPKPYWASVRITKNDQANDAVDFIDADIRRSNFRPIISAIDFDNWATNHMIPYEKLSPANRWLALRLHAKLYAGENLGLKPLFDKALSQMKQSIPPVTCLPSSSYQLERCFSPQENGPSQPNEIYFDVRGKGTYIERTTLKSVGYGQFRSCSHYFIVPNLRAIAEVDCRFEEEMKNWSFVERGVKQAVQEFVVN